MLDYFENRIKVLRVELSIASNNELLAFEQQCISELIVVCSNIIYDVINKRSEKIEVYKKTQSDLWAIQEALQRKNFNFQNAFINVKNDYIRRAIYTLEEACEK